MRTIIKLATLIFIVNFLAVTSAFSGVIKQFEQTSYYLKDVCFINKNVGWAAGAPHWDQSSKSYKGTIIKTVDSGQNWSPQEAGVCEEFRGVAFVDANNGWVVGANGTILYTGNGGESWIKQPVGTTDEFRGVVFSDAKNGWATSVDIVGYDYWGEPDEWKGSIWHTGDGGIFWQKQTVPGTAGILNRIDFIDSKKGWAVGVKFAGHNDFNDPEYIAAVYHTSNGGLTWVEQYTPDLDIVLTGVDFVDDQNGWVVGFKGNSGVDGGTIFHTSDGGNTWEQQEPDDTLWDVHFQDENKGYAVGSSYGTAWGPPVYRTSDGGETWEKVIMDNHDNEGLFAIAVLPDRAIAVGDYDFISISNNPWGTYEWPYGQNLFVQSYINTHFEFEDVFFIDENHGWVVGARSFKPEIWGQIIFHTDNGGTTWEKQYEASPSLNTLFCYTYRIDSVFFVDSMNGWAVGGEDTFDGGKSGAILYTSDGGKSWTNQGAELRESWDLEFFACYFMDNQNGWALAADRFPYDTIYLAHTTNGGNTWSWVDTKIEGLMSIVQGGIDFTDELNGWAVGGLGNITHTNDGGNSWVKQNLPNGYDWTRLYAINFIDNQNGWIAGEGLFFTNDGGENWTEKMEADIWGAGDIRDIKFIDSLNGWLIGNSGRIMFTNNGGNTFTELPSGTDSDLLGMSFVSSYKGWIVGDGGVILQVSKPIGYALSYTAGTNGSISGTTSQTVAYGGNGTAVTAVPATGYHFVNWSDGSAANPRTDTNVTNNISVTANFAKVLSEYTLTYTAGTNGSISGTTSQIVAYGGSGTAVTAVPATGYHFVYWSDGSTANPRTDTNVTNNISVTANFANDTDSSSHESTNGNNGSKKGGGGGSCFIETSTNI